LNNKINLLGLSHESLVDFFHNIGQPSFRAKQFLKWVHQRGCLNFDEMTDFNIPLREQLKEIASIETPKILESSLSKDGTEKFAIKLNSGSIVEMVVIPEEKRNTLCISSQAGCALQCTFCATGAQGFDSNLTSSEIIGQLWLANNFSTNKRKITNVVFMGMGEPLLNYENVIESAQIMKDQNAYGLSRKRITISTSGIVPQILNLPNDIDVSLAISLHAPNDELRNEIVPINNKYPLKELISSCQTYLKSFTNKKNITIEYILIKGVNDSLSHAKELSKILNHLNCKINLIPFNPFDGCDYERSSDQDINTFKSFLMKKGFIATVRRTRGDLIDGACGQLVGNLNKATKGKKLIKHKQII